MIRLCVIDVDGTLTDAGIYYDNNGNELKKFCTRDAAGFFAFKEAGIATMVITGRECEATSRRMKEMKVDHLIQNVKDKRSVLSDYIKDYGYKKEDIMYIGDDLNDICVMEECGIVACPADSCEEVLRVADIISTRNGGNGVVREVAETYFKRLGIWEKLISRIYESGR